MPTDTHEIVLAQLYSDLQPPNAAPLSIEVLAGALERYYPNCQVRLMTVNPTINADAVQEFMAAISGPGCELVGISMPQGTYHLAMDILTTLDSFTPSQRPLIVLGHALPTYMPHEFLHRFPWAIAVRGWGEEALISLVHKVQTEDTDYTEVPSIVYVRNGQMIHTPLRNALTPEPPKRLQGEDFFPRLETSRGCHYGHCTFCTRPPGLKNSWDRLPVDTLMSSIRALKDQELFYFTFADEDFIGNDLEGALEIAQGISHIGGMSFSISVRADNIFHPKGSHEENTKRRAVLQALKQAGLSWVFVGVESFSDAQLRRYGKGIQAQDSLQAVEVIKELELEFEIGFILFDPFVTTGDLQQTATALRDSGLWRNVGSLFTVMRVQKDTYYESWLKRKGLLKHLDINILAYEWDFQDQTASSIALACLEWSRPFDPLYRALRNIERTYQEHLLAKHFITTFRQLDLEVFEHALTRLKYPLPGQEQRVHPSYFDYRRDLVKDLAQFYKAPAKNDAESLLISEMAQFL